MGPENNRTKDDGSDGSNEDSARRHIFSIANQRMKIWGGRVGKELKRRIQRLSRPNDRDGQDDPTPIRGRDAKEKTSANNKESG